MTRQVFARAVDMFRGHKHSFDFAWHNSARYDVCANARAGEHFASLPHKWQSRSTLSCLCADVPCCA